MKATTATVTLEVTDDHTLCFDVDAQALPAELAEMLVRATTNAPDMVLHDTDGGHVESHIARWIASEGEHHVEAAAAALAATVVYRAADGRHTERTPQKVRFACADETLCTDRADLAWPNGATTADLHRAARAQVREIIGEWLSGEAGGKFELRAGLDAARGAA